MMMERHDLGALVCFVGENVRYITSVFQGNWKNNIYIRYCVLPRGGNPWCGFCRRRSEATNRVCGRSLN
jgi:hypothetical protein